MVIGAGTAGLITAGVAASLGARVALIERDRMGGDCLNVGCVPSKGLIRAARGQAELTFLSREGLITLPETQEEIRVAFSRATERLRKLRAQISKHDSAARYRDEFGVDLYFGEARFINRTTVEVTSPEHHSRTLTFKKAAITTGARAATPPIPGLDTTAHLTNETLFEQTTLPRSITIIGAGPIGCEMAQSLARLGSEVHLIEQAPRVLPREDPPVAEIIGRALVEDGVKLHLSASISSVTGDDSSRTVHFTTPGAQTTHDTHEITTTELLCAIGRTPNIESLNLSRADVRTTKRGIVVNDHLQTSNRSIFAAGDVASSYQFTHFAEASAAILVQNALFFPTARTSTLTVPWCTYTSPEVAHVGLTEQEAHRSGRKIDIYSHPLAKVDRAQLDGHAHGTVRLITAKGTKRLLGATIVAPHAGEMIGEVVLALQNNLGIDRLSSVIHPYPTHSEAIKRAAVGYLKTKLSPPVKRLLAHWFNIFG